MISIQGSTGAEPLLGSWRSPYSVYAGSGSPLIRADATWLAAEKHSSAINSSAVARLFLSKSKQRRKAALKGSDTCCHLELESEMAHVVLSFRKVS
mmetsp:Transcript_153077/g.271519  ORF Transcript_153077/g.271519 Transcript_153077/m.271519 type:complete len:96 (-) Transcript_153077:753-1040(-)